MTPDSGNRLSDPNRTKSRLSGLGEALAKGVNLRSVLDGVPLPVVISSVTDGQIGYTNASLESLFGVAPDGFSGRHLSFFFPKVADQRRLTKAQKSGSRVQGLELESKRRDGSPLWLSVWQHHIVCGKQECHMTILLDVTDRKHRQVELQRLLELSDHDRETIACEIHDGVVQEMIGALMQLEATCDAIEKGRSDPLEQLQTVMRLLRDGIREARRLMDGVRPPELDQVGLCAAVQALVDKIATTSAIGIEFVPRVDFERLGVKWENSIYRVIQEGLNNVRRHSQSRRARVELTQRGERLEIVVQDWGVGFDPKHVSDRAFGLKGIRQRAQLLGGTVRINSSAEGTRLQVEVPLVGEAVVS